jgi:hypothetical protein
MFDEEQVAIAEEELSSLQGSPDGLGASPSNLVGVGAYESPEVSEEMGMYQAPTQGFVPNAPMDGYQAQWLEPEKTDTQSAMRSAGITALVVAAAGGIGLALGGGWGAVSGVLASGAVFNTYRAQKDFTSEDASKKHEAMVSTVFAVVGLAAGGYAGYKAYTSRKD